MPYEKVDKNEPVCIADEVPFDIPETWEWVRLGSIGDWGSGATPSRSIPEYYDGDIPWLKTGDLNDGYIEYIPENISRLALEKTSVRLNPTGSVLIAMYGATIGKVGILTFPATTNQACCACLPIEIHNEYLFYFLMSQKVAFVKQGEGGAQPNISKEKIVATLMPLPSLAEQHRIVAKIKELLPYVERYGEAHSLVTSLNEAFPELLKKSILQEAVQGKLVPQDPTDEPASILLKRIRAEKEQLIKAGKIKRDKHESVIFRRDNSHYEKRGSEEVCIDEELPFDLPDTWSWTRLGELCSVVTGRLDANAQTPDGEYAFFTCGREVFRTDTYAFDCDAILLGGNNASGDYKMHRYSGKFNAYQRVYVISGREPDFLNYLYYVITFWLSHLKKNSQGTTTRFIKLGQVTGMLVPVPPCAEQKRITQTMQLLLSECDRLQ